MRSSPSTAHPVRALRKERRLTQAELAQAVGVSRQTIVAVEQGSYAPSVFLALSIGRVLGASVETLFGQDEAVLVARSAGNTE
ncbi:helix-turn-helix transcriptional regulator [Bogoriella caseilytica]|uniref:Putative transcriptional regulator n=1 Tax=Bogoriella caseilytica TaxID=56055 RepID=A0A3N2BFE0_9MICO|nr:helix-turn-helix transcriptional regulator [Bogoriella caseilytica]ROR73967.1 putative transcriptional regulator [Bogoriella caseilytica]